MAIFTILYGNCYPPHGEANMYREICQTDLSEFHSTVWEKTPKVSIKLILLCCMAIIAILLYRISFKNSLRVIIEQGSWWRKVMIKRWTERNEIGFSIVVRKAVHKRYHTRVKRRGRSRVVYQAYIYESPRLLHCPTGAYEQMRVNTRLLLLRSVVATPVSNYAYHYHCHYYNLVEITNNNSQLCYRALTVQREST